MYAPKIQPELLAAATNKNFLKPNLASSRIQKTGPTKSSKPLFHFNQGFANFKTLKIQNSINGLAEKYIHGWEIYSSLVILYQ